METSSRWRKDFISLFSFSFFFFLILSFNKFEKRRDTKDRGIPAGRLFRFIREFSSRRYFPRVHVPIPIGGVVNTVWPGIYPCYLIVSFHSNASSYTTGLYAVVISNSHPLFPRSLYRGFALAPNDTNIESCVPRISFNPTFPYSFLFPKIVRELYHHLLNLPYKFT